MRTIIPLKKRPLDIVIIIFFAVNILFITYIVDFEQIAVPNSVIPGETFTAYPVWPPAPCVDLVHWWGENFDPVLLARPAWWKATIWLDALLFGPFYLVALFAFLKGKEWIRIPSIIYSAILFTNVTVILSEEIWGTHASPVLGMVLAANAAWLVFPFIIIARMYKEHPFTKEPKAAS
ncbi:MAG: DUF2781 domain-containing protein [Spirochaetales bacterium]|nr:DUF2781 domain-containing protein [Spirochaetales bacterium]